MDLSPLSSLLNSGVKPVMIYHLSYIYKTMFYFPGFVGSYLQWVIDKSCISLVQAMIYSLKGDAKDMMRSQLHSILLLER